MNPSIYRILKVKQNKKTNPRISKKILTKVIQDTHETCSFSTIPYFRHNTISSLFCLQNYNSGNCIAMSMCAHKLLQQKNIYSFLIPASIPKKFQREGYLELSHVAVCIPDRDKGYYILDLAFYFLEPLYIRTKNLSTIKSITNKNIYDNNNIRTIKYSSNQLHNDTMLNKYQFIPKNTLVCNVYFENDPNDSWNYYIIEVLNPDDSIGRPFLNIRKDNFITITDKYCNLLLYIKQSEQFKDNIIIKYKNKELFNGVLNDIKVTLLKSLNKKFKLFIPNGLKNALL